MTQNNGVRFIKDRDRNMYYALTWDFSDCVGTIDIRENQYTKNRVYWVSTVKSDVAFGYLQDAKNYIREEIGA